MFFKANLAQKYINQNFYRAKKSLLECLCTPNSLPQIHHPYLCWPKRGNVSIDHPLLLFTALNQPLRPI